MENAMRGAYHPLPGSCQAWHSLYANAGADGRQGSLPGLPVPIDGL